MSAFVCSTETFKSLAVFASYRSDGNVFKVHPHYSGVDMPTDLDLYDRERIASIYASTLEAENYRSYNYRYNESGEPNPISITHDDIVKYSNVAPVVLLKMCNCVEYQSCETANYREMPAYKLLNHIRLAAICDLDGYDAAPWG